jgi:hypothetical protein
MVSLVLTTSRVRRKLHHQFPEFQSYEETKVVDPGVTWTHFDHEIEGIGKISVRSDVAYWCHIGWHGPMTDMPHVTWNRTSCRPYIPINTWHMSPNELPCVIFSLPHITLGTYHLVHLVRGICRTRLYFPSHLVRHHVRGWNLRESRTSRLYCFWMQCHG